MKALREPIVMIEVGDYVLGLSDLVFCRVSSRVKRNDREATGFRTWLRADHSRTAAILH